MTFKEAKKQAIKEAMELNRVEGSHKWKTISMNIQGDWFADTSESHEMTENLDWGFFMGSSGRDILLKVKFTDTPICDWLQSVASVPSQTKEI